MKKVYFIPIIFTISLAVSVALLYMIHHSLKGYRKKSSTF